MDNSRWAKLGRRLAKMSWDELQVRARQEIAKRTDLLLSQFSPLVVKDSDGSRSGRRERFFFQPTDAPLILDLLRKRLPEVVTKIICQAEQICQHRFDLLGYQRVEYGPQIDWHLDAVHAKQAPRRPWFQVPYLDFAEVGDAKIIWELSRHQHLVTLAKAYRLTEQPQYAQELFRQWYDWQRQNPYPIGINWASNLEVAFRSLSWLWISHLLRGCSVVPERFLDDLRRALMLNARHIERFLSTYFSPNTHLLGEGVGLFFIGTLCPGSPLSERWQKLGWNIVLREAERQVRHDGMHFEHSIYYHTYALDLFLHARILADLNGIQIPAAFDRTIEKMLEVTCTLGNSGPLPNLGDDDGGRVFDPRRNAMEHMLDPLALGAVLFNRADFKTVGGAIREETIWLSGVEAVRRFDALRGQRPPANSFVLEPSGIYVMSGSESGLHQLVINAGPRESKREGHRHADALSVQLAVNGRAVLIDPGTFVYVDEGAERNRFRGTTSHNTAHIDGLSQVESEEPFEWRSLPHANVSRWVTGRTFDFFEGSSCSDRSLGDPIEHRRYVFYGKPHFWLVRDVLKGAGTHQVETQWHFAAGSLSAIPGGVKFLSEQQVPLTLLLASNHGCSQEISSDWHSPVYGRKEPAPLLRVSARAPLPMELVSLLIPVSTTNATLEVYHPSPGEEDRADVRAYRYSAPGSHNSVFIFAERPGTWRVGPWSSDARFVFCMCDCEEQLRRFVICGGSYLDLRGWRILAAGAPLKHAEFFFDSGQRQFHCSNEAPVTLGFIPGRLDGNSRWVHGENSMTAWNTRVPGQLSAV